MKQENPAPLKELEKIRDSVVNGCMRCGFCTFFCPVYQETLDESSAARGKIALARELLDGNLDVTPDMLQRLETCLMCNSCVANCPITVRSDQIIMAARADCATGGNLHPVERFFFRRVLLKREIFGFTVKFVSKLQRFFLRADTPGVIRHLPDLWSGFQKGGRLPALSDRFLRHRLPEVIPPAEGMETRAVVGFFSGCGLDFIYPRHGINVVEFLTARGIEVHFPKNQNCCGMPVLSRGDISTARKLAEQNAAAFAGYDVVLTACATCGSALKHLQTHLGRQNEECDAICGLADKMTDINEYVTGTDSIWRNGFVVKEAYEGKTVTWHDPCHLVRHQGIKDQPRQILKALSGVRFEEMVDADRCCGMAGSFGIHHPDLSHRIALKKIEAIKASGADLVVTSCPGCLVQLNDALARSGMEQRAIHIMDLLNTKTRREL